MKSLLKILLLLGFISTLATSTLFAQAPRITVDEFGVGSFVSNSATTIVSSSRGPDPSGGLPNWAVLTFDLTTTSVRGVQGDLLIHHPDVTGNPILDVIRFDGNFHLSYYSDDVNGYLSPADTPGPPDPIFANMVELNLQGSGNNMFVDYVPTVGQPGYDASGITYRIYDPVPEPGSASLFVIGLGIAGLAQLLRRRFIAPHHRQ